MKQRFKVTDYLSRSELQALAKPSDIKGFQAVCTTWSMILGSMTIAAYFPHILTWAFAIIIIGGRQLALAILMHDASHYSLFKNRFLNSWIGTWLCAYPIGFDLDRYREHHLKHHQYAGSPKDPDKDLVEAYPVTRKSLKRKIMRDLFGITGLKRFYGVFLIDFGYIKYTVSGNIVPIDQKNKAKKDIFKRGFSRLSGKVASNGIFLGILFLLGKPELYLLWVIAYLTTFSLFIRIRSIAEHACTIQDLDPLKSTRTTYAGILARLTVAPHRVNYHLEHHILMSIPYFRLPHLHALLKERGALKTAFIAQNYLEVLKTASRLHTA